MLHTTAFVDERVKNLILDSLLLHKFEVLTTLCQEIDEKATPMVVSQLISDLCAAKKLPPVVLNPRTRMYEVLPQEMVIVLKGINDMAKWRQVYRNFKKKRAREINSITVPVEPKKTVKVQPSEPKDENPVKDTLEPPPPKKEKKGLFSWFRKK
jgi:hypothetical protein